MSVPEQSQALAGLSKNVKDLIGENFSLAVDGTNVRASGDVKTITVPWTEFQKSGGNTGHFIPIELPASCVGRKVTLKGRTKDRTAVVGEDRLLIQRLENLTGTALTVEMDGETLMTIDFAGVIPIGEAAYDPDKKDFGSFGKQEKLVSDLNIVWKGAKGKVTGELKKVFNAKLSEGYWFPVGMSAWYADGVPKTVNGAEKKDKDIIVSVEDEKKPITFKYNGLTVLEFDLSGMTKADG